MSDIRYALKRRKLRRGRRRAPALLLLAAGIALLWLVVAVYRQFMPMLTSLAEAEANNRVAAIINNAIAERIAAGELKYSDIVSIEKDDNGAVAAITTDVAKVNRLKAEITADVISAFAGDIGAEISIPIGSLTGIKLLSGKGPGLPIEIVSAAEVNTELVNRFSTAGINQTCHQIIVRVNTGVSMMVPGKTIFSQFSAEVAAAETVIIGQVPESYTFFEADEKWDESLEQYDILS